MMDRPAANGLLSPGRRATAGGGWGVSGPHMSPIFGRLCWIVPPTLNGNASPEQSSMGRHVERRPACVRAALGGGAAVSRRWSNRPGRSMALEPAV